MNKEPKTKILFIITKSNWGGAQRYVYDVATRLPQQAFDGIVLSGNRGILTEKLESEGIRTISIDTLARDISFSKEFFSFFSILSTIRHERPNILHLNSSKAAGLGALAGKLCGVKKIIFTVHGWPFNEKRSGLVRNVIWFFSWLTVMLSTDVIVLGQEELRQAQKMPLSKHKITLIHSGILAIEFKSRSEARTLLQLPQNAFVIGSIGELTWNKNYAQLITVAAKLKEEHNDFILNIIGSGELREVLEAKKIEKTLDGQILQGFVKDGYKYLTAYDVFILPSFKEGLPYVILEAGLAGLPVIASNVGGIPDLVENEVTGLLIDPRNGADIKNALARCMHDATLRTQLGTALKEKVEKEFSFAQMLQKTISLYTR